MAKLAGFAASMKYNTIQYNLVGTILHAYIYCAFVTTWLQIRWWVRRRTGQLVLNWLETIINTINAIGNGINRITIHCAVEKTLIVSYSLLISTSGYGPTLKPRLPSYSSAAYLRWPIAITSAILIVIIIIIILGLLNCWILHGAFRKQQP